MSYEPTAEEIETEAEALYVRMYPQREFWNPWPRANPKTKDMLRYVAKARLSRGLPNS